MGKDKSITNRFYWFYLFFTILTLALLFYLTISNKTDVRGVESNVVHSIQLILTGNHNLYQSPTALPFNITQYSPIYYMLSDGILTLLKAESADYFFIRVITRVISMVILLTTALLIYLFFRNKIEIPAKDSLILSILFILITFPWFSVSRPDVLVALVIIAVIYLNYSYIQQKRLRYPFFTGALLFIGLATKLNAAIFVVIIGIFYLFIKDWKAVFLSLTGFLITLISIVFIMKIGGYNLTYIKENIIDGIENGYSFEAAVRKTYSDFFSYFGSFFIAIILLVIYKFKYLTTHINHRLFNFLLFTGIVLLCYSFITGLKVGSAHNYFNEFLLLLILLTGYLMKYAYEQYHLLFRNGLMVYSLSVAIIFTFYYCLEYHDQHTLLKNNEINVNLVRSYLKGNLDNKYFFSTDREISLSFPDKCILFPLDIHNLTFKQDTYNYDPLKKALRDGTVKYFISRGWPNVFFGVKINEYYSLSEKYGPYLIYQSKNFFRF